jgi:hypothetical protein
MSKLSELIADHYSTGDVERMAKAICSAWPKVPDGCAALCMDRLGDFPPEGCRHAVVVHGFRARMVLADFFGNKPIHTRNKKAPGG